jgi:hypothetical protein
MLIILVYNVIYLGDTAAMAAGGGGFGGRIFHKI